MTSKTPFKLTKDVKDLLKQKVVKCDIGCGANKQGPDFIGVDYRKLPGVNIVHNLEDPPIPLPENSVDLAVASHVVEHINPAGGIFLRFMDDVWRILKPDGEFAMVFPYAGTPYYWQDPTHCNGCNEMTWWYFDPLHESNYYYIYKPKPWKIKISHYQKGGFMEVVLIKRREDASYA